MQTTTLSTPRNHTRHVWIMGVVFALLVSAIIATLAVTRWDDPERTSVPLPVVGDVTTLALDRDGADLFAPVAEAAPNTTDLRLDRNGADVVLPPSTIAPNVTRVVVDRNTSFFTYSSTQPGFINPSMDGTLTDVWMFAPGHAGFIEP